MLREKPLPENVLAVEGLLKLHQATLNEEYRQLAQRALSAYVEANRNYGEFAATYALAVDLFLNAPVEITVEGQPGGCRRPRIAARRDAGLLAPSGGQALAQRGLYR